MTQSRTTCTNCGQGILEGLAFCPHCGAKQSQLISDDELERDPYRILQVSDDAEPEVIDAAYRGLARKYHPDISNSSTSEEKIREINWAHDLLTNPSKLAEWKNKRTRSQPSAYTTSNPNAYYSVPPPSNQPPVSSPYSQPAHKVTTRSSPQSSCLGKPLLIVFAIIVIGFVWRLVSIPGPAVVYNTSTPNSASSSPKTATPVSYSSPTPRLSGKIILPITYQSMPCIRWTEVGSSQIGSNICIYGRIYKYGPYSNHWDTIQFSLAPDSFRVKAFRGYYTSPLTLGDCAIVYGRIRDYDTYLVINPDMNATDSVRTGSSILCN